MQKAQRELMQARMVQTGDHDPNQGFGFADPVDIPEVRWICISLWVSVLVSFSFWFRFWIRFGFGFGIGIGI
jgi:hypothetical protein